MTSLHAYADESLRAGRYQHILPNDDPLIWLPDCFAWPVGAGGDWLAQVRPAIDVMCEVG